MEPASSDTERERERERESPRREERGRERERESALVSTRGPARARLSGTLFLFFLAERRHVGGEKKSQQCRRLSLSK